eukprot:402078_1
MAATETQHDLTVFHNVTSVCNDTGNNKIIDNCSYLQRMCVALRYYSLLCKDNESKESKITKELVVIFGDETYKTLLDDYYHILEQHRHQLVEIGEEMKQNQCNVIKCNTLKRHYRGRVESRNRDREDDKFVFYTDCFDRCHHLFFHLYPMGLKLKRSEIEMKHNHKEDMNVDALFKHKRDLINQRKKKYKINRFTDQGNKFLITKQKWTQVTKSMKEIVEKGTFLDEMQTFTHNDDNLEELQNNKLYEYIYSNEYDTDAVEEDLQNTNVVENGKNKSISNLWNQINNKLCVKSMIDYISSIKLFSSSFSTGYIFYYWPYFKRLKKMQADEYDATNKYTRHTGHNISELFVPAYYKSFKAEILSSGFVTVNEWKQQIVLKGNEYARTQKVKNIRCKSSKYHEIKYKAPISRVHLYAIITYCDWSDLSSDFSATFRKNHEFESLQKLKARNARYHHFSKALIEAVIAFGIDGDGEYNDNFNMINKETGPFYCGLSSVIKVPQFVIYLNGPFSTSKDIEIAINFAKRNGMIIQLDNQNAGQCTKQTRFLDCSFISNYAEENERLFMWTEYPLKIESIRIIETAKNYQSFMHSFYVFDAMISGVSHKHIKVTRVDVDVLEKLINEVPTKNIDTYVRNTFKLYLNQKNEIKININDFDGSYYGHWQYVNGGCYRKLGHLIFHSVMNEGGYKDWNDNEKWKYLKERKWEKSNDSVNILNTKILQKCPNLRKVEINTTYSDNDCYPMYRFSLLSFLSAIETSKPSIKYIIRAKRNKYRGPSIKTTAEATKPSIHYYNRLFGQSIKKSSRHLPLSSDDKTAIKMRMGKNQYRYHVSWLYNLVAASTKDKFNINKWTINHFQEENIYGKVYEDFLVIVKNNSSDDNSEQNLRFDKEEIREEDFVQDEFEEEEFDDFDYISTDDEPVPSISKEQSLSIY